MFLKITRLFLALLVSFFVVSCSQSCKKTETKKGVFFINLKHDDTISSPVLVKFGVEGMTVRPAMEDVHEKTSGHHHLLIDNPEGFTPQGMAVPKDDHHIHYGQGQTEDTITLSPGLHTLTLQFADGAHLSYGKPMATTITIRVEPPKEPEDLMPEDS